MHEAALRAAGLDGWRYQRLPVPPDLLEETVRALPGAGFRGANITIPHKEAALAVANRATETARAIGAANTLTFEDGSIDAENTDAAGFLAALPRSPRGATALVLGAGGSARAVVWALLSEGAAEVMVWNRTSERAVQLCAQIGGVPTRSVRPADFLVNCTAVGLSADPPVFKALPLEADTLEDYPCVVDLAYRDDDTELIAAAKARGSETVGGLEILARQGALSFEVWTGRPAPLEAMRAALGPTP
jgi:shikimate dehydrogenase